MERTEETERWNWGGKTTKAKREEKEIEQNVQFSILDGFWWTSAKQLYQQSSCETLARGKNCKFKPNEC